MVSVYPTVATIVPWHQVDTMLQKEDNSTTIAILISASLTALAILIIVAGCFYLKRRGCRADNYKGKFFLDVATNGFLPCLYQVSK